MTSDAMLLVGGANYGDIHAAAVKDRRRAARVNAVSSLQLQRAEIQSRLSTQRRQLMMGDGAVALSVKRNEAREIELTTQIDNAIADLARFDAPPASDFLDGDTKPAPKAKTARESK